MIETFDPDLIAPCGMNCNICMAYLREKNKCPGCREIDINKSIKILIILIQAFSNLGYFLLISKNEKFRQEISNKI